MRILIMMITALLICQPFISSASPGAEFEPAGDGIYNYCPAAFEEDGIRHIYYCTNVEARNITDHIGYRHAEFLDGAWRYSDESIVLGPTRHWVGWDTVHVCDPDVVKGKFFYKGEEYRYLMAYLGCTTTNNQNNEIGIAVAKEPGGPFIKVVEANPIVSFLRDRSTPEKDAVFQWGVGQPALLSLDHSGKVMLIYTSGTIQGTMLFCERWDFGNLDHPEPIGEDWKSIVTNKGSIGRDMKQASLNNADVFFDGITGHLYLAADGWPHYINGIDTPGEPTYISVSVRILRYTIPIEGNELLSFTLEKGSWEQIAHITPEETGFPRNHNPGVVHDPYGWSLHSDRMDVLYSVSDVKKPSNSLWTYRIHRMPILK